MAPAPAAHVRNHVHKIAFSRHAQQQHDRLLRNKKQHA
jgi:hypothetical protein